MEKLTAEQFYRKQNKPFLGDVKINYEEKEITMAYAFELMEDYYQAKVHEQNSETATSVNDTLSEYTIDELKQHTQPFSQLSFADLNAMYEWSNRMMQNMDTFAGEQDFKQDLEKLVRAKIDIRRELNNRIIKIAGLTL